MSVVPGEVDTDQQPPMTVPLRHFVVGLGFLLLGAVAGTLSATGPPGGGATLAHIHLLLVGWVCVTIMGAMTQFVPVWSGTRLHSRRLANAQLLLVSAGLLGFAAVWLWGPLRWLAAFGGLLLLGFWTFAYNVARTLPPLADLDVTERHFALALAFFALATVLGFVLALDLAHPVLVEWSLSRTNFVTAHATLAVFGAVLTTVAGALYQLATMFTQTELRGVDRHLCRVEEAAYPSGVAVFAAGRLAGDAALARTGAALLLVGLLAFTVVLARRLYESRVERTPMLARYAVVPPATAVWAALAATAWARDPLSRTALFGAPGGAHLLALGVVGFVVLGTLYHVVPFIVWVHQYSDRLGFESVPMIDDLYDDRVAAVDLAAVTAGTAALVAGDALGRPGLAAAGGGLVTGGFLLFAANAGLVLRDHSPYTLVQLLFGRPTDAETAETAETADSRPATDGGGSEP